MQPPRRAGSVDGQVASKVGGLPASPAAPLVAASPAASPTSVVPAKPALPPKLEPAPGTALPPWLGPAPPVAFVAAPAVTPAAPPTVASACGLAVEPPHASATPPIEIQHQALTPQSVVAYGVAPHPSRAAIRHEARVPHGVDVSRGASNGNTARAGPSNEPMGRSSNDDRSDTMNPNNDAYWADQENRFGSAYDEDDVAADFGAPSPPVAARRRELELDAARRRFEDAFATPASRERDRRAAVAKLLRGAERILTVARDAALRQGVGAHLFDTPMTLGLMLDDGRHVRVDAAATSGLVTIAGRAAHVFTYEGRAWHALDRHESRDVSPLAKLIDEIAKRNFAAGVDSLREQVRAHARATNDPQHSLWERERLLDESAGLQAQLIATRSALTPLSPEKGWEEAWSTQDTAQLIALRRAIEEHVRYLREGSAAFSGYGRLQPPRRLASIVEAQARISGLLASLPEELRNSSWEDRWTPETDQRAQA